MPAGGLTAARPPEPLPVRRQARRGTRGARPERQTPTSGAAAPGVLSGARTSHGAARPIPAALPRSAPCSFSRRTWHARRTRTPEVEDTRTALPTVAPERKAAQCSRRAPAPAVPALRTVAVRTIASTAARALEATRAAIARSPRGAATAAPRTTGAATAAGCRPRGGAEAPGPDAASRGTGSGEGGCAG